MKRLLVLFLFLACGCNGASFVAAPGSADDAAGSTVGPASVASTGAASTAETASGASSVGAGGTGGGLVADAGAETGAGGAGGSDVVPCPGLTCGTVTNPYTFCDFSGAGPKGSTVWQCLDQIPYGYPDSQPCAELKWGAQTQDGILQFKCPTGTRGVVCEPGKAPVETCSMAPLQGLGNEYCCPD